LAVVSRRTRALAFPPDSERRRGPLGSKSSRSGCRGCERGSDGSPDPGRRRRLFSHELCGAIQLLEVFFRVRVVLERGAACRTACSLMHVPPRCGRPNR
jgi:hypothetical protein